MANVEIYTKQSCPYCNAAKLLLKGKGVSFTEYDIEAQSERRDEAVSRSGGLMTVPQIFIDGKSIGGYDDMRALDDDDKLDPLLGSAA